MTDNEFETCCEAVKTYIVDAESAESVEELAIRLKSASDMLQSVLQECVTIYDELEQKANHRQSNLVAVQFDAEAAYAVQEEAVHLASRISSAVIEKMRDLETQGVVWYAEEEPVEVFISGAWKKAWHIENDGAVASICLDYLGSPRIEVPLSALRRPQEQS